MRILLLSLVLLACAPPRDMHLTDAGPPLGDAAPWGDANPTGDDAAPGTDAGPTDDAALGDAGPGDDAAAPGDDASAADAWVHSDAWSPAMAVSYDDACAQVRDAYVATGCDVSGFTCPYASGGTGTITAGDVVACEHGISCQYGSDSSWGQSYACSRLQMVAVNPCRYGMYPSC